MLVYTLDPRSRNLRARKMKNSKGNRSIVVSYGGTHQTYHQALAAQETGHLAAFLCSVYASPGKWGGRLAYLLGKATMSNRRIKGFDPAMAVEYPWPFLLSRVLERMGKAGDRDWLWMTHQVDRWSAKWLEMHPCDLVVASETGAYHSFKVAKRQGTTCLLDCPQAHPDFLTDLLARAADDLNMPPPPPIDRPDVAARKLEEFAMADHMTMITELQAGIFERAGFSRKRMSVIPYGIDNAFWEAGDDSPERNANRPLRVLFVGGVDLRKGIPYLLRACEMLGSSVELWLVGPNSGKVDSFLASTKANVKLLGRRTKVELRTIYREADVFVLPSLIDTFGYVGMEAMACGTPIIVTENCGVPVPEASWRAPIMNSAAIAARLQHYIDQPKDLATHGLQARDFSRQFTPVRYREQLGKLFLELLAARA